MSGTDDAGLGSLRSLFPGYFDVTADERGEIYKTGLVVPDTNILLDLYRFRAEARSQMLEALSRCGERLFVPNRVSQEFLGSRINVIRSRAADTRALLNGIDRVKDEALKVIQSARESAALPTAEVDELSSQVKQSLQDVKAKLRELIDEKNAVSPGQPDAQDTVLEAVSSLVSGKVGTPMTIEQMDECRISATRRFAQKTPPGFEDAEKDLEKAVGDYVIWRQVIAEASRRSIDVLIITSDTKADWVRRDGTGKAVGPHPELVAEMQKVAKVQLIWADAPNFLQEAKTFLSASVSERTISESRKVSSGDAAAVRREREKGERWASDSGEPETERRSRSLELLASQRSDIEAELQHLHGDVADSPMSRRLHMQKTIDELERRLEAANALISLMMSIDGPDSHHGGAPDSDSID